MNENSVSVKRLHMQLAIRWLSILVLVLFVCVDSINHYSYSKLAIALGFCATLYLLYQSRRNLGHFVVFLFIFYSIYKISPQYLYGVKTTAYTFFYNQIGYDISATILSVFVTILAIWYRPRTFVDPYEINPKENPLVFYILVFLSVMVLAFGVSHVRGSSYEVNTNTSYEYFIMVFMFAFQYSGGRKVRKFILLILGMVYILQDFYYGGRIASVELLILVALLYFYKRIRYLTLVISLVPTIVLLDVVQFFRAHYTLHGFSLASIFSSAGYSWNTFGEVLYSSSGLVNTSLFYFDFSEKIHSFFDFIISIFVGGRLPLPLGQIVSYISTHISLVGGGGYFPVYFYFWFGWFGVGLSAVIVSIMLHLRPLRHNDFGRLLSVLFIALVPRWYLYSPLLLFRFVILNFVIAYVLIGILDKVTNLQGNS